MPYLFWFPFLLLRFFFSGFIPKRLLSRPENNLGDLNTYIFIAAPFSPAIFFN